MMVRKLIMGLMASAFGLTSCLVAPLDEEAQEDIASTSEAIRGVQPDSFRGNDGVDTSDPSAADPSTSRSMIGPSVSPQSAPSDPAKPQPDPWDGTQQKSSPTTVNR